MDTLTQWFGTFASLFEVLLAKTQFGAVVAGTLAAIGVTQLVKIVVIHSPSIPNGPWRVWYLTTAMVGLTTTTLLWPTALGFVWGLIAGTLLAPSTYLVGTRLLYRWMPQLESRISATPRNPQ